MAWLIFLLMAQVGLAAEPPLHVQIDNAVLAAHAGPFSGPSSDAEFLRRASLDLTGVIPTIGDVRAFLADSSPDKRARLIDRLLASNAYPRRMQEAFTVMLAERRNNKDLDEYDWQRYFQAAFAENRPWDALARELVSVTGVEEATRPAIRFFAERGPTSYDQLTRDVGRLFLGMDLQCAQCHDHPSIEDYKQSHYFGIYAYLNTTTSTRDQFSNVLLIGQKGTPEPVAFKSVFTGTEVKTAPSLPGLPEVELPSFKKGEEYVEPPQAGRPGVPKFDARVRLARDLTSPDNLPFQRNIANRLWFLMLGHGIVHPLDLHHSANPPSHPKLLNRLAAGFVADGYNIKAFLREVALSETYQRSSLLPAGAGDPPQAEDPLRRLPVTSYAVANMKPLSAEQLFHSVLRATGQTERVMQDIDDELRRADPKFFNILQAMPAMLARAREEKLAELRDKFVAAFGNPPGEPEDEFNPTLAGALFLSNNELLLDWLKPRPGNLVDRLSKLVDATAVADELYLSILGRLPVADERIEVASHLSHNAPRENNALGELAWALLTSTEFRMNH